MEKQIPFMRILSDKAKENLGFFNWNRVKFPRITKVKCLNDVGLFLHAIDVSGGHTLMSLYSGVVGLQGV